jgi:succinate dehydrogenase/fumarate reductase cytochrome b subunit
MVPLKFGVAFPIVYHSLAGYRHLVRAAQRSC